LTRWSWISKRKRCCAFKLSGRTFGFGLCIFAPRFRIYVFKFDNFVVYTQYSVVTDNANSQPGQSGLYNRIAVLRAERGISRQELADAVGVNYQTIGFLERGDYGPSLKLALDLAAYFGLPVEAIFSTQPFRPLSEQVYGRGVERNPSAAGQNEDKTA
jgi:putative transcriptional regulator